MKQAKGGGAGEKYWQENLKQTDPIKVDITRNRTGAKPMLQLAQLCQRKRGYAEGPSGSKKAGFPEYPSCLKARSVAPRAWQASSVGDLVP